jgi:hypothetical protein
MAKAIKARRAGDTYQARVFWVHALEMATGANGAIATVTFESDAVSFIDDVIVSYAVPVRDLLTATDVMIDAYQCKYHMTVGGAFNGANLCDPEFIGSDAGRTMLGRMYEGYLALRARHTPFRMTVVSNYHWDHGDPLAEHLHEGMLRASFFAGGPNSKLGQIRAKFESHLKIDAQELEAFLKTVRFDLGQGLSQLAKQMDPLLRLAGLRPIDLSKTQIEYDDLAWNLFNQDRNQFDRDSFHAMAVAEKLVVTAVQSEGELTVRSMVPHLERQRSPSGLLLDLTGSFEGRHPKKGSCWLENVPAQIGQLLRSKELASQPQPIHVYFDCHLSIAFALGNLFDPKKGLTLVPAQRSRRKGGYDLWAEPDSQETHLWDNATQGPPGEEVVLAISVTHDVNQHLTPSLEALGLGTLSRMDVRPKGGCGHSAVAGGTLAWHLAHDLRRLLGDSLPPATKKMHIFFAGPVAMAFLLGHALRGIAPQMQLYEHDFEGEQGGHRYSGSLCVPLKC